MEAEIPEERLTWNKNKEKKRQSQYPKEDTDGVEEKSEHPKSECGDRNSSRSSLMAEKEEDTEAKFTEREHQGEPTTGQPKVMTDKLANRRNETGKKS